MRRRARRAPTRDDAAPRRQLSSEAEWAGPSRRARVLAVLIAVVLAAVTFAVVSRVWRRAAPPPRPVAVEVRLVPTPAAAAPARETAPLR